MVGDLELSTRCCGFQHFPLTKGCYAPNFCADQFQVRSFSIVTFLRTLMCLSLIMTFSLPVTAGEPSGSRGLGLSTDKEEYDWAQFSHMSEKKKTCFLRFLTESEMAEVAQGVKPWKKRLAQKAKQLNIFCSR